MTTVMAGAEPASHSGDETGVLVVHGFTGSPSSMRAMADAAARAGHTVELPLLPGHGTAVEDMIETTWNDWTNAIEECYLDLAERTTKVVVVGLSMGGALTAWLATRHQEISGIMCINALVRPIGHDMLSQATEALEAGVEVAPSIGSDIAKEGVTELAYEATPLRALMSLNDGVREMMDDLESIRCPTLVASSVQDHVVDPTNSDFLANVVSGPVRKVVLERSYHVATQDHDRDLLIEEMLGFITETTK